MQSQNTPHDDADQASADPEASDPGVPAPSQRFMNTLHFQKTLNQIPFGIAYLSLDGHWLFVNPTICSITGYTESELLAATYAQLCDPEDLEVGHANQRSLLAGETLIYSMEQRFIHRDGGALWVNLTGSLVPDADGKPDYMLISVEDISRQKATLEQLRLSEERFRTALLGTPITVFNQDLNLRYTWIYNPSLGFEPETIIGKDDLELFERPEDAAIVIALKRRVIERGVGLREEVIIWNNQEQHIYDMTIEPLRNARGSITGITCAAIDISERVRAAAQIQHANVRANLAINVIDGFIYEYDLLSGIMERSEGFCKVLGYDLDEAPATLEWWRRQIHPNDLMRITTEAQAERAASGRHSVEYRVRHKQGHLITVLDRGVASFDEHSQIRRIVGVVIDISARKQTEQRQQFLTEASKILSASIEYETRLSDLAKLIVPNLADWCVIHLIDERGRLEPMIIQHSDPAKIAQGREWIRAHPPDPDARMGTHTVLRTGQSLLFPVITDAMLQEAARSDEELTLLRSIGYCSSMIVPMMRLGQVIGTITFVQAESSRNYNADDLLLAEDLGHRAAVAIENARLYAAERQARTIAEQAATRAAFLVAAGELLSASLDYQMTMDKFAKLVVPRFSEMFVVFLVGQDGLIRRVAGAHIDPVKEAAMLALQEIPIHPSSDHPAAEVIRTGKLLYNPSVEAIAQQIAEDYSKPLDTLSQLVPESHLIVPMIARQRVIGAISLGMVTPGRNYDTSDQAVAEVLADRAAQAIDNALLYHDAQEAIKARDVFLSVASHELKTPLTSLIGRAQLIQRRINQQPEPDARDQHAIQVIIDQARRLNTLIITLLDVSRLSQSQITIQRELLDLDELVQRVVSEFQQLVEQHTLVYIPASQPIWVSGDPTRLEQVFQNLLQNAVKYSPQGGTITIQSDQQLNQAIVSVTDQGIGIPEASVGNLFQRFYRVDSEVVQRISGIGVGLYIVREILTAHDGTIMVESTEGVGSTFRVSLPLQTP